jgi:large subunit ribosomal protein L24
MNKKYKIKVNDKVMVICGKDRGKVGTVKKILRKSDRVIVDQVNIVKRHMRGNPYTGQAGGIVEKEAPIHISNVALFCESCSKPTRVGYKFTEEGKKLRYCKKCKEILD